ncbi:CMGC/CDK protein kinase [Thecamonas trahens ATCC 50062]|uniref:CMGC/CDK protein kinase n=1 Tax=Thecamonas trahens ATCC 50062 TaxID=461836 RepID=A0A0L0DW06_THETB|nr:CMGC/CDK protein kinase [Thecamonas trahens ATCC 50062]KNC56357.1 CMGC/CDK protein kinase [Thecamonas trahens ATCC 50062]|eukprot:XP_013760874.1 CMGC/CDK protein kinase [Thecamonas trahens ATCC 50062]
MALLSSSDDEKELLNQAHQLVRAGASYRFVTRDLTLWKAHPSLTAVYRLGRKVGSGTFGVVYTATHRASGINVALKHFKSSKWSDRERDSLLGKKTLPSVLVRELEFLIEAQSPNVLGLYDVLVPLKPAAVPGGLPPANVFMACELAMFDLESFRTTFSLNSPVRALLSQSVVEDTIRGIVYALACALSTCHERRIVHCDIKPANALAFASGGVKVSDFGLAKRIPIAHGYDVYDRARQRLVSLWYRAPELVLRFQHYTPKIDVWALGCTMAQLILGTPLFRAKTEEVLISNIVDILGTPDTSDWPDLVKLPWTASEASLIYAPLLRLQPMHSMRPLPSCLWRKIKPHAGRLEFDVLEAMLTYNPESRISANELKKHVYFADVRTHPEKYRRLLSQVFAAIASPTSFELAASRSSHRRTSEFDMLLVSQKSATATSSKRKRSSSSTSLSSAAMRSRSRMRKSSREVIVVSSSSDRKRGARSSRDLDQLEDPNASEETATHSRPSKKPRTLSGVAR